MSNLIKIPPDDENSAREKNTFCRFLEVFAGSNKNNKFKKVGSKCTQFPCKWGFLVAQISRNLRFDIGRQFFKTFENAQGMLKKKYFP